MFIWYTTLDRGQRGRREIWFGKIAEKLAGRLANARKFAHATARIRILECRPVQGKPIDALIAENRRLIERRSNRTQFIRLFSFELFTFASVATGLELEKPDARVLFRISLCENRKVSFSLRIETKEAQRKPVAIERSNEFHTFKRDRVNLWNILAASSGRKKSRFRLQPV